MNLKRLHYFCQLADIGNFTRAADHIGIAQPALTIAIKKLEQEVGLQLINRAEKKALLTAEGKVLYKSASRLLAQAKQMMLELDELKNLEQGTVRFGVSAMMGSYYFPEVLTEFKQQYPNIKVQLVDQGTAALEKMLLDGELDITLIRGDTENPLLRYRDLVNDEIVAGIAHDNDLAVEPFLTLEKFCQQPLVLFNQGYFLREVVEEYAKKNRITLDLRMETNLIELQKSLVKNGIGITTCLPRIIENDEALRYLSFQPKINIKLSLAWKKNHYLSNASKAFMAHLCDSDKGQQ